jgi:uncharacterized protein YegL
MPRIGGNDQDMSVMKIAGNGNFQFSAARPETLGATEYTLVTLVTDRSGSVSTFSLDIDKMEEEVIKSCAKNQRASNLMMRRVHFNDSIIEENGFMELSQLPALVPGRCGGMTALYDATYTAIEATLSYADYLQKKDFCINGVVFIITDGANNQSINTPKMIAKLMEDAIKKERIESINTILIGVLPKDKTSQDYAHLDSYLRMFKDEAKLSQYETIDGVDATKLAKLANFISKSISSQSQSLGTGTSSQLLTI